MAGTDDDVVLDDIYVYLTCVVGLRDHKARYELLAKIRSGDLPIRCNGNLMSPDYWDYLTLEVKDGGLEIKPLSWALKDGEYRYTASMRVVRMLWPPPAASRSVSPVMPPVSGTAPISPKEWFEKALIADPRRKGEGTTSYASRLYKKMETAPVTTVWEFDTMKRAVRRVFEAATKPAAGGKKRQPSKSPPNRT